MSLEPSTEDVFAKMDALLKRHQHGAAAPAPTAEDIKPPAELAAVAERRPEPDEMIPTLTDVVEGAAPASEDGIPVLTEVVEATGETPTEPPGIDLEETLRRLEDQLVEQLENQVAPQLSAAFDRALTELLESARLYVRQAVHETLTRELRNHLDDAPPSDSTGKH